MKLAFVSAKGGVGKTTTVLVGNAVARLRGDRVMAVDVDADLGDLSAKFSERWPRRPASEHFVSSQHTKRYADIACAHGENKDRHKYLVPRVIRDRRLSLARRTMGRHAILETHYGDRLLDCGTVNGPLFSNITNDDVTGLVVVASERARCRGALDVTPGLAGAHGFGRLLQHTGCSQRNQNPVHLWIAGPPKNQLGSASRISFGFP